MACAANNSVSRNAARLVSMPTQPQALWVALLLLVALARGHAETLRVTTWNLGFDSDAAGPVSQMDHAADVLRALNPDIILLQRVKDWHKCQELAEALKPLDYYVVICSAFQRESPLLPQKQQLAILSKSKAYVTWAEAWSPPKQQNLDGVAFAAIQAGSQRLGFFTGLFGGQMAGDELGRRLQAEIHSIGLWETNQVQTLVVAGSFDPYFKKSLRALRKTAGALEKAGLVDATETLPAERKTTLRATESLPAQICDYLFAGPQGFPVNPSVMVSESTEHFPLTCDIELDPEKVTTALALRADEMRQKAAQRTLQIKRAEYGIGGALILGLGIRLRFWIKARKQTRLALQGRQRLPVRVDPTQSPASVRPVIFSPPPPVKPVVAEATISPQTPRPALRLQNPPRIVQQPGVSKPPAESRPTGPEPGASERQQDRTESQGSVAPPDSAAPPEAALRDTSVRQGVIRELSGWLKHKLVRKLVTDRAQLMQAQQIATHMATTLDNRLARIEAQIQQQNQAYVRRIEELNKELAAAREENRELIRERIAQVKAEMEAARARALAEANLDSTSFRL